MKKMFLVAASVIVPAMAAFAQDHKQGYTNDASPIIESQFSADFPDATNLHFARLKGLNVVSFTQDKESMNAYYDGRHQLVGIIHTQSFADLPDNAQKEIQTKYPGYSIANVVKFDDNQSEEMEIILYGVSLDDADNYFVELKSDGKTIVVKVDLTGAVEALGTGLAG
jgi:hypothetical protein